MIEANKELTILLAEDDDGHATLIERNLSRAGLQSRVVRARDGSEALEFFAFLTRSERGQHGRLVVLLDIRMPQIDGIEVLRRMKTEEPNSIVPVYMLTTSDDPREVEQCFLLGCNAYLVKPIPYDALVEAIKRLVHFLQVTTIPVV